jgi:hypothetical protein
MTAKGKAPKAEPRPLRNITEDLERAVKRQESAGERLEQAQGDLEVATTSKKEADKQVRALKKELDLSLRGKA